MSETQSYDIVLIGAGHQGLIATGYLAKSGFNVGIFEAENPHSLTLPYTPFHDDTYTGPCAHLPVHVSHLAVNDLDLAQFGWKMEPNAGQVITLGSDDNVLHISGGNQEKTKASLEALSPEDAANFFVVHEKLLKLAGSIEQISREIPHYTKDGWKDLWGIFETGNALSQMPQDMQKLFSSLMKSSLVDFLNEHFKSDLVKSAIAMQASMCSFSNPHKEGSAIVLLEYILSVGSENPIYASDWQPLRGSLHPYLSALRDAAGSFGARVHIDTKAKKINFDDNGDIESIETNKGIVKTQAVLTDISPALLFNTLIDPKNTSDTVRKRFGQGADSTTKNAFVRLKFALKELPKFTNISDENAMSGEIHICANTEDLGKSYANAKTNTAPEALSCSIVLPSVSAPDMGASTHYPCSIVAQYVAPDVSVNADNHQMIIDLVSEIISKHAPNFKDAIMHAEIIAGEALGYGIGALNRDISDSGLPLLRLFNSSFDHHALQAKHGLNDVFICGFGAEGSASPQLVNNGFVIANAVKQLYTPQK